MSVYGKSRYTLDSYEFFAAFMNDRGDERNKLPSLSTLRLSIFPHLLKTLFVNSDVRSFQSKSSHTPITTSRASSRNEAVVVLLSSWAKYDVRSLHVLREIVCISKCRCREAFGKEDIQVDSINHVKHRAARSLLHHSLWLNKDGTPFPGRVGMKIRIHSTAPISDINRFHDSVQVKVYNSIYRREQCTFF